MEYRLLGRTGVSVSPLCLGAMMSGPWGSDDRADAIRVIHRALDAGINFAGTAGVYSGGVPEEITGEALRGRRDDVVLAAKFFVPMDDRPDHSGGSRKWIMQEAGNSLRRLKADYTDLYQVHRPGVTTDAGETLGALADLVRQGRVRCIGSSSYPASQIVGARWVSRERNLARFVTGQPPYSILVRGIGEDVLPAVPRYGTGTLVYSPLSGGWLAGRWREGAPGTPASAARPGARFDMSTPANQRKLGVVEEVAVLAGRSGMTMTGLALAWAVSHPGVTSAIIGPRTMEQLESQFPSVRVTLDTEILDRVGELVAPGVTLNADDNSYGAAGLTPQGRRR